jgi:hypothetical protein
MKSIGYLLFILTTLLLSNQSGCKTPCKISSGNPYFDFIKTYYTDSIKVNESLPAISKTGLYDFYHWDSLLSEANPLQQEIMYRVVHAFRNDMESAFSFTLSVEEKKEINLFLSLYRNYQKNVRISDSESVRFFMITPSDFFIEWATPQQSYRFKDTFRISPAIGFPDFEVNSIDAILLKTSHGMRNQPAIVIVKGNNLQIKTFEDCLATDPVNNRVAYATPFPDHDTLFWVQNFITDEKQPFVVSGCSGVTSISCIKKAILSADSLIVELSPIGGQLPPLIRRFKINLLK